MSPKLVVHKIESGGNRKSLGINIEDSDDDVSDVKCKKWISGWINMESKKMKKSKATRGRGLVVSTVKGDDIPTLDLDSCATLIEESLRNSTSAMSMQISQVLIKQFSITSTVSSHNVEQSRISPLTVDQTPTGQHDTVISSTLEHSLEKVRENNARIMENIHMLNRTLDYTKKKEIEEVVGSKSMRFPCDICGKCFVYETGLKRHCATRHTAADAQPRWQVVWTCIECYQVWPQQALALAHARLCCNIEDTDIVREIKTSSLLQCEFCDKVYTSIPRLLKHSKLHTTAKNYECTACRSSFQAYKAAELHWLLCPWLKIYYKFALPKMWLCHICDRKFKNYEQLYSHRYKVGHYIAKYAYEPDKKMELVSYQCEQCGQWYHHTPLLEHHRRTKHATNDIVAVKNRTKMQIEVSNINNSDYRMNMGIDDIIDSFN